MHGIEDRSLYLLMAVSFLMHKLLRSSVKTGTQLLRTYLQEQDLRELLVHAVDLTAAIDQYLRITQEPSSQPKQPCPTWRNLILRRNWIHHRLLSLPRLTRHGGATGAPTPMEAIANITRIAALIYSDMVIFPLPYVTQVKPRSAAELRRALNFQAVVNTWYQPDSSEFLTWVLVMGAIAATETKHRPWFVYKLIDLLAIQNITDWDSFFPNWERLSLVGSCMRDPS